MKKLSAIVLLLFFSLISLFALNEKVIWSASNEALVKMAEIRGLSTEGSSEEIRNRILDYEQIEKEEIIVESEDEEEEKYTLEVLSADSLITHSDSIELEGNVVVSFSSSGQSSKTLSASSIILDTKLNRITALGSALYRDSDKDSAIQELSADIFTLSWEKGDLYITDGTTQTERKNSDEKPVSFYTSGETLSYLSEGAMLYDNGYITSNPEHAYSSIKASQIAILPGEDMFLYNAVFNIGRVPIFYLPFFFYPGSRIVGNPAFGFSSTKGAFLNTTFEIFGSYPKIEDVEESSSFTAILKSTEDQKDYSPVGYYYKKNEEENKIEEWAKKSKSYLALLFDSYSGSDNNILHKGGVHLALDSTINLFDGKVKLSLLNGLAYSSPVIENNKIRYYGANSLEISAYGFNVKGQFPFYSDEYVLRDFSNRLTGFSISPLMGEDSTFPTSSSTINSYSRSLELSFRLPSKFSSFFLSSLNLRNLTIRESYKLNNKSGKFEKNEVVLPSLSMSLSGKLIDISSSTKKEKNSDEVDGSEEKVERESNPLLMDLYTFNQDSQRRSSSNNKSSFSLDWSISGDLSKEKEYKNQEESENSFLTSLSGKINANAKVLSWISISNVLTPNYSYKENEVPDEKKYSKSNSVSSSLTNNLTVSLPFIGITYKLNTRLWTMDDTLRENKSSGSGLVQKKEREEKYFEWDKDYVRTHELSFSKTFSTAIGSFGGRITYVLPPLTSSLSPSLSWSYGNFSSSLSLLFKEKDDEFKKDRMNGKLSYSGIYLLSSLEGIYDFKVAEEGNKKEAFNLISLTELRTKNKKFSIEERIDYSPEKNEINNYFNSLRTTIKADSTRFIMLHSSLKDGKVELERIQLTSDIKSGDIQFWMGRVYLSFNLKTNLDYSHRDKQRSSFSIEPSIKFSIAEFLDFTLSFKSENNRLGQYFNGDKFSFNAMWEDLKRSFDFKGNGRKNTSFILRSISLDIVHEMEDWNLNCKYSTEIVKSNISGGRSIYTLQPSLSIYLSWKTMPDLKTEENWKQIIKSDGSVEWEKQ